MANDDRYEVPTNRTTGDYVHALVREWISIELMKVALRSLTGAMQYEVPEQDLRINLSRMPAMPESRFVICNLRRTR